MNFPEARLRGSTFMFRSGLDGSTEIYKDHVTSLLTGSTATVVDGLRPNFYTSLWMRHGFPLLLAGALSIVAVVILYAVRFVALRTAAYALFAALGLAVPTIFLFSQSAVIHPYLYGPLLAIPMFVCLFGVLPAFLASVGPSRGVYVFAAVMLSACYSMVQLRVYAMRTLQEQQQRLTARSASASKNERPQKAAPGYWTSPAHTAKTFTGEGSMTWTVDAADVGTFEYTLAGKTMTVVLLLKSTSVSGTRGSFLQVAIPDGYIAASQTESFLRIDEGGKSVNGYMGTRAGDPVIRLMRIDRSNWAAATNNTSVSGEITFEIR